MNEITVLEMMPVMDIGQAVGRRNAMVQFVKSIMAEGTDFGVIPGTGDKPTLLKPGAEKLTTFFGLSKRFQILEKIEDWTGKDHDGEPFFYYLYRCQLYRGETMIAEADGSCNSMESKYRWRWVKADDVPANLDKDQLQKRSGAISEFEFAIEKAETSGKYGKPAEYWQQFKDAMAAGNYRRFEKQTRNGKSYPAIEIGSDIYRVPNTDIASQVNTIQKMAQKRALVAATLLAVNASEFFTQDLEDIVDVPVTAFVDARSQYTAKHTETEVLEAEFREETERNVAASGADAPGSITEGQLKVLHARGRELYDNAWDEKRAKALGRKGLNSSKELSKAQASKWIDWLVKKIDARAAAEAAAAISDAEEDEGNAMENEAALAEARAAA